MLHLQSIHVKFHLHSKRSSAQHLHLFFLLLLFLLFLLEMSLCELLILWCSCSYGLLLCLPVLDLLEACVFVVVVVVVVGDVMVGASVSAVLLLLWFGALLPSVGLAGGLCFCWCRRRCLLEMSLCEFLILRCSCSCGLLLCLPLLDLLEACVFVVVVVVVVGDVLVRASVSAVLILLWFGALLPSVGLAGGLCFCCCCCCYC